MILNRPTAKPSQAFFRLWLGQIVSITGSGMTGFALGVHTFQETGSAIYFSLITLSATLPGILISPLAGVIADRFNRRVVMIISDLGSALATLALAALFASGNLELWQIYPLVGLSSLMNGFQLPASQAAVTQLVPKEFYAQASGMLQMSRGMQFVVSPILAGLLMEPLGVSGILLIDVATFVFRVGMLLGIRIPSLAERHRDGKQVHWWAQLVEGFRYLSARPGMLVLIAVIAVGNFMIGFLIVLVGPMILAFATERVLGIMNSLAALGLLVGNIIVSVRGVPGRLVPKMFAFMAVGGVGLTAMGLVAHPASITIACFLFFLSMPFVNACQESIWRRKIELGMQSRMFAFTRMIVAGAGIVAFVIAGPLADRVFEPLLAPGGALANSIGVLIGVGPGRGIALMLLLSGVFILLTSLLGYAYPGVRGLESDYPDVERREEGEGALGTARA